MKMTDTYSKYSKFAQESASVAGSALDSLLANLQNEIYLKSIGERMMPYVCKRIQFETNMMLNSYYMPKDLKFDDCYLDLSPEPLQIPLDSHQSHILAPLEYPQGTYSVDYVKTSKVSGELGRTFNKKQGDASGNSPDSKLSTGLLQSFRSKRNTRQSRQGSNMSIKREAEVVATQPKKLDMQEVLAEEEVQHIEFLRELLDKKRFKFVKNQNGVKNQKVLLSESFMMSTTQSFVEDKKIKEIKNKPYTFDSQGNVMLVRRMNAGNLAAAKKDMQPNKNYILPKIQDTHHPKRNASQGKTLFSDHSFQDKLGSIHAIQSQHSLVRLITNSSQTSQLDQIDKHAEQPNVHLAPDNGVVLRDHQGNFLSQGDNYSLIQYQRARKMNLSLYKTQFRNNFKVSFDQSASKEDSTQIIPRATNEASIIESSVDYTARNSANHIRKFSGNNGITISSKNPHQVLDDTLSLSASLQPDSRNIRRTFDQNSMSTSFDLQNSLQNTRFNKPLTSSNNKRRQQSNAQILIYDNTIAPKKNKSIIIDGSQKGSEQRTLNQKFNLNLLGKLNNSKEYEEVQNFSVQYKEKIIGSRNQQIKNSSQIHREMISSQQGPSSRPIASRGRIIQNLNRTTSIHQNL